MGLWLTRCHAELPLGARRSAASNALASRARSGHSALVVSLLDDVPAMAAWMAGTLTHSGYVADFSPGSLAEVDRFFDEHAPGGRPTNGGLLSEDLGQRLFGLGGYVGESFVARSAACGQPKMTTPRGEVNVTLTLDDGWSIWPVQRVMKRLRNGPEDGIAAYGAVPGVNTQA